MVTVPPDELQRRLVLDQSEKYLRKQLAELDWPFLGLFGEKLNKDMRAAVSTTISSNPSVGGFIRHLELYPALFSIYLCQILLQTFGTADYFQLWPEIQKALRLRDAPGDTEWASPDIPDTFDRCEDAIGGVRWSARNMQRSSSVRQ